MPNAQTLAVLISFSGAGGVEKMVMNLVREFANQVPKIDLLVLRASGPHFADIPDNVNVIQLKAKHTSTAIPEIASYLKRVEPRSLLVAKDRAGRAAVRARSLAGVATRIVVRLGTNLSTALTHRSRFNAWLRTFPMKRLYKKVDHVVAVSEGVAEDTIHITEIPKSKVSVIRNPVITPAFVPGPTPDHPWLQTRSLPVIVGVGRLSTQKDFPCLIKAFSIVNKTTPSRLLILGEGKHREELESLVLELNLQDSVQLPGFQSRVIDWVAAADLFVLSSRWEGSPNALTEALALGTPSVSTRCPSGPNELLNEGEFGPLVPVEDHKALAQAMIETLQNPLPSETLKSAVKEYNSDLSAKRYLDVLGWQ